MFRCGIGGEKVGPSVAQRKIVVEKRPREYHDGERSSVGWEIVREIAACDVHAQKYIREHGTPEKS